MIPLAAFAAAAAVDVLVVGMVGDPISLDPHRATDLVSAAIVGNVCEPLGQSSRRRCSNATSVIWLARSNG